MPGQKITAKVGEAGLPLISKVLDICKVNHVESKEIQSYIAADEAAESTSEAGMLATSVRSYLGAAMILFLLPLLLCFLLPILKKKPRRRKMRRKKKVTRRRTYKKRTYKKRR